MTEPVEPLAAGAVQQVDLMRVAVPLRLPFEASHGTETVREVVVVRVHGAGGEVGHGECDALGHPTYTHEYAAGAYALLRDEVVPALLAAGSTGTAGLDRWHPMARSGLVTARLDAALRAAGRPLAAVLGAPAGNDRLDRTVVLGRAGSIEQLGGWVDAAVASGAAMVKLKVAGPSDLRAAVMVRRAFPGLALAADANGALDGLDAGELRRAGLDELALRYLEQPYPPDELLALAELRRHGGTPICLDESITSVPVWCGGMLESGIGRAAAVALAALPGFTLPADLSASDRYYERDVVTTPFVLDDGCLAVPSGPGLGVDVDRDALESVTTAVHTLRR